MRKPCLNESPAVVVSMTPRLPLELSHPYASTQSSDAYPPAGERFGLALMNPFVALVLRYGMRVSTPTGLADEIGVAPDAEV